MKENDKERQSINQNKWLKFSEQPKQREKRLISAPVTPEEKKRSPKIEY